VKSFVRKSTDSEGKINAEHMATLFLKDWYTGKSLGLVGCASGLKRHREEWASVGIGYKKQYVVEIDKETANSLKNKCKRVIEGDLLKVLDRTIGIDYVDFDGVEQFNNTYVRLYKKCAAKKVKAIKLVGSARGCSSQLRQLAKNLGIRKRFAKTPVNILRLNRTYPIKLLLTKWCEQNVSKQYNFVVVTYGGLSCMWMILLKRKEG
jgi:hypothetical protein